MAKGTSALTDEASTRSRQATTRTAKRATNDPEGAGSTPARAVRGLSSRAGNRATGEALTQAGRWPSDLPGRKFVLSAGDGQVSEQARLEAFVKRRSPEANVPYASQAVNDAASGRGKNSGTYRGYEVLHASAGSSGAASCTVFFIRHDDVVSLLAVGSHKTSSTYDIHWSAAPDKFPEGKAVSPTGNL